MVWQSWLPSWAAVGVARLVERKAQLLLCFILVVSETRRSYHVRKVETSEAQLISKSNHDQASKSSSSYDAARMPGWLHHGYTTALSVCSSNFARCLSRSMMLPISDGWTVQLMPRQPRAAKICVTLICGQCEVSGSTSAPAVLQHDEHLQVMPITLTRVVLVLHIVAQRTIAIDHSTSKLLRTAALAEGVIPA
jgi:hypothetical protein